MPPKPDSELTLRIRKALARRRGISEKRMFGGVCFFANDHMIGGATGKGELVIRVGPDRFEEAIGLPGARPMDFTKRPMRGFVSVAEKGFRKDADLREWLARGIAYARSLPPKSPKRK